MRKVVRETETEKNVTGWTVYQIRHWIVFAMQNAFDCLHLLKIQRV